jgi:hypothetical protein
MKGSDSYSRKTIYEMCIVKTSIQACSVVGDEISTRLISENLTETGNSQDLGKDGRIFKSYELN